MFQQVLKIQQNVRQKQLVTNLNAGVGEAWAGQTRARLRPIWKLCSWAVTAENLGRELPMGSEQADMWHGHMQSEPNQTLMNEQKLFQVSLAYFRAKINHDRIRGAWFLSVLHCVWVYFPWSCFWLNSLKYDFFLTTCDMGTCSQNQIKL